MDSDKKMEEIELLEKALTDCRAFKKWIAGTLSKVEKLNGVANAEKEKTQNLIQSRKNANKSKKKKNKKSKSKVNATNGGGDHVGGGDVAANVVREPNPQKVDGKFRNIDLLGGKDEGIGLELDYGTEISINVSGRNSHQCLSDYAKINKRYIEVKRSLESLMIDMKRVDDKLKHPKDEFFGNGLEKSSSCCCHHK